MGNNLCHINYNPEGVADQCFIRCRKKSLEASKVAESPEEYEGKNTILKPLYFYLNVVHYTEDINTSRKLLDGCSVKFSNLMIGESRNILVQ